MKIKYSPCNSNRETAIEIRDANTVLVDGEEYSFPEECVAFPDVAKQTNYVILEAHRESGELFLTITRYYTKSCPWDTGDYQEVSV